MTQSTATGEGPPDTKGAGHRPAGGPAIETRKVQKSGRGSTVISLPKEWVQRSGLKPGDPVALHFQRDGSLLISPHLVETSPRLRCAIEVDATRPERTARQVIAAYLEGCGQIELRSRGELSPALRQKLHESFRKIVGLEVVDEAPDRILLLDLASPSEFPMGRGLRRMNMLTKAMVEDAMSTVVDGESDRLQSVLARDDEVDRIFWLVFKQHHLVLRDPRFAGKIEMTPQRSLGYMLSARIFERVADHACVIARSSADLKGALPKGIAEGLRKAGTDALELLDRAFQCFVGAAGEEAHEVIEEVRPFEKRLASLRESIGGLKGKQAVALAYVLESIERTGAYAADLAELAINSSVVTTA